MKTTTTLLLALITTFFAGCGTMPIQRGESASVKASEALAAQQALAIKTVFETRPPQKLVIHAGTNSVEVPIATRETIEIDQQGNQAANSDEANGWGRYVSVPMGVKLILAAVGILLLIFALKRLMEFSPAARAGIRAADQLMANRIRALRARLAEAVTDDARARIQSEIAEVESDRGRLAASR